MKSFLTYILSFTVSYIVFVYGLRLPYHITNDHPIIDEIYIKKAHYMLPLDAFFIFTYINTALFIGSYFNIKTLYHKIFIISIVTFLLTTVFCYYFKSKSIDTNNIFSRWFHNIGYSSVIYDIIIVNIVYIVYIILHLLTRPHE
jgi:hypothetical protein